MGSDKEDALQLVRLCNQSSRCIIALSSGSGNQFTGRNKSRLLHFLHKYHPVELKPISADKAIRMALRMIL